MVKYVSQLHNLNKCVTLAKAGVQKISKKLDSRFRGNDNIGLLQFAHLLRNAVYFSREI